ncbi:MAG: hypothetical protein QNJ98_00320 [Planctomycetota bacterium]|nr:hypothetical protein [Planctomycetota bacterium]
MADERAPTPDEPRPEREDDRTPDREPAAESRSAPAQAPMPSKPKKRSVFRRRDELGLVILALVLTGIVWTIARGSVVEVRPPITDVLVVWERPPGSPTDVAFAEDAPRITVVMKASVPDYEEAKNSLAGGLRLRLGPVNPGQPERDLSTSEGDRYELPFHPSLLAAPLELPRGKVFLVEMGIARIEPPPNLEGPWPGGLRVELVQLEKTSVRVDNVRTGLFSAPVTADEVTVDDLRLNEDLGTSGIRDVVLTFEKYVQGSEDDTVNEARAKAVRDFGELRMRVKVYGGEERVIDHEWRWALSDYDLATWDFRLGNPDEVNIKVRLLEGRFVGTKAELDFVEQNPGKWHFEIAIFGDGKTPRENLLPTTGSEVEQDVPGTIRFVHDGDPGFGDVRFAPKNGNDLTIKVKRKQS